MRKLEKLGTWRRSFLILSILCFFAICAQAQTVSGVVNDESGEPVIGATVRVQGTSEGTVTDFNGKFSIKAASNATLTISSVGYLTQKVSVGGKSNITVTLAEDNTTLEDVVVIGYGVQKKKLVTGATVQVKGEEIAKLNTTNALEAMQSSTPGVQITSSSTQPGKGYKVYIRGIGTIGDSAPLYVIDGVAGGNLDGINPADIESIDILKDAASAAIYGSRAANGVILVTTKQGKAGKMEISYNGAMGWSNVYKRPQMLNAQQFMTIMDEYSFNTSGQKVNFADFVPKSILDKVAGGWEGTDWWGEFENKNAVQHNHSVTLTGGTDRSKFAMSYTYTGNEGVMGADQASYYKLRTSMPSPSVRTSQLATARTTIWLRTACIGAISTACSRPTRSYLFMLTMVSFITMLTTVVSMMRLVLPSPVPSGTTIGSTTRTKVSQREVSTLWQRAATLTPALLVSLPSSLSRA